MNLFWEGEGRNTKFGEVNDRGGGGCRSAGMGRDSLHAYQMLIRGTKIINEIKMKNSKLCFCPYSLA